MRVHRGGGPGEGFHRDVRVLARPGGRDDRDRREHDQAHGRRAGEVIQGVRNMVRKGEARRSLIPIEDTIDQLLRIVHADAIRREAKVTAKVDPSAGQVWGDPVQFLQVLLNLALNSLEAMSAMPPDARRLFIRAGRDGNGDILVSVRDSGPGFPGETAEQLFEPFFSTKSEGTGMGLAISRSIIDGFVNFEAISQWSIHADSSLC